MSSKPTPFKHPKCGGVIMQTELGGKQIFVCDTCGARAVDIDDLVFRGLVVVRTSRRQAQPIEFIREDEEE